MKTAIVLCLVIFLSACISGGKPAYMVEQYTLEYPSPVMKDVSSLNEALRVERFSVAQAFNSPAMVYRPTPFQQAAYTYHRWRVNPGDMITDYLLRDLRNSGIFRAVFSYRDAEDARFLLEGGVEEFLESDDADGWKASLSLHITLLDLTQSEITKKVIFQRNYRFTEPLEQQTAEALARSMSKAMEKCSEAVIKDVYAAVKGVAS